MGDMTAVFEREIRVQSRDRRTWRLRVVVGLSACGWLGLMLWQSPGLFVGSGSSAFLQLNFAGALILSLVAPALSHDLIARERREGTLGLLLSTPLKPAEVLRGKTVAVGVRALTVWLAMAPILMLPVLQGGVTGLELIGAMLAQGAVTLVGLMSGLASSCWNRQAGWALFVGYAFMAVVAFTVMLPVGLVLLVSSGTSRGAFAAVTVASVLALGFAAGLYALASQELRQVWSRLRAVGEVRDEMLELGRVEGVQPVPSTSPVHAIEGSVGDSVALPTDGVVEGSRVSAPRDRADADGFWANWQRKRRAQLLESDPWRWLLERRTGPGWRLLLTTGVIGLFWVGGWISGGIPIWPLWVLQVLLCLLLPRLLHEERQNGMLEVLRTTPMMPRLAGAVSRVTWIRYGPLLGAYVVLALWWRALIGESGPGMSVLPMVAGMWSAPYLITWALLRNATYGWGVLVVTVGAFKMGSGLALVAVWTAAVIMDVPYTYLSKTTQVWIEPVIQMTVTLMCGVVARHQLRAALGGG